tara:strand:+ start:148 stop:321 length:174 start_codon:yes stop_codon:yes gene_type:complete
MTRREQKNKRKRFFHEFKVLCGEYLLDVDIALENERVVQSVLNMDLEELKIALKEEF